MCKNCNRNSWLGEALFSYCLIGSTDLKRKKTVEVLFRWTAVRHSYLVHLRQQRREELRDICCYNCGTKFENEGDCLCRQGYRNNAASVTSQQASYRPPERGPFDGDRPRRAGRRRKLRWYVRVSENYAGVIAPVCHVLKTCARHLWKSYLFWFKLIIIIIVRNSTINV